MPVITVIHVAAGTAAFIAGVGALLSSKGGRIHRRSGQVFALAMIVTAGGGAMQAVAMPQALTAIVGLFTVYLVVTGVQAARRTSKGGWGFDAGAALIGGTLGALCFRFGFEAQASASGGKDGFGPEPYFFFGAVAVVAVVGDIFAAIRRGGSHRHRMARHLWRMGFALYVAAGSLLDGPGTSAFPEALRGSLLLTGPVTLIGLVVAGWWVATLVTGRGAARK